MIHQCALKLTEVCCQRNWIKEGDRSWCVYAMETRIGTTVFAVLLIVWSAVSTCWLETIAFVLPCYLLRQRMGGWHARTSFQCLIISISAVIVTCKLLGKAVMQLPTLVVIIIDVVLIISAAVIQPAYPKQLRFTSNEIKANVKKKNLVLVFVLIVQIAVIFFGNKTILTYSFFGVMLTVVSVLIQKFKREDEHFDEGRKSS